MDKKYRVHRRMGMVSIAGLVIVGCICIALASEPTKDGQAKVEDEKQAQTSRNLKNVEIALRMYYSDHHDYPKALYQLTTPVAYLSSVPNDPYAPDKSIRYQYGPRALNAKAYSVGPDGIDDNGASPSDQVVNMAELPSVRHPNPEFGAPPIVIVEPFSLEILDTFDNGETIEYELKDNLAHATKLCVTAARTDKEITVTFALNGKNGALFEKLGPLPVPSGPGVQNTNFLLPEGNIGELHFSGRPFDSGIIFRIRLALRPKSTGNIILGRAIDEPIGFGTTIDDDQKIMKDIEARLKRFATEKGRYPESVSEVSALLPPEVVNSQKGYAKKGMLSDFWMRGSKAVLQWTLNEVDELGSKHSRYFITSFALADERATGQNTPATSPAFTDERASAAASQPNVPAGTWSSVDFVVQIDQFSLEKKQWQGDLYLKNLTVDPDGLTSLGHTLRDGFATTRQNTNVREAYAVRELNGETYLFLPWLNGDVTSRGRKPQYYVLKRVSAPGETLFVTSEDMKHVLQSAPTGKWRTVDFVLAPQSFRPGIRVCPDELYLNELTCNADGSSALGTFKEGLLVDRDGKTSARYYIKSKSGATYLFVPWLNADVTLRGMSPHYYVMEKFSDS